MSLRCKPKGSGGRACGYRKNTSWSCGAIVPYWSTSTSGTDSISCSQRTVGRKWPLWMEQLVGGSQYPKAACSFVYGIRINPKLGHGNLINSARLRPP